MRRFLRIPKMQMFFCLTLIFTTALVHKPSVQILFMYILALILTLGLDLLLLKIRKIEVFLLSAALVTGSIIGLLNSPTLPIYDVVVVVFLAMLSKHFIKRGRQHIFNPAAFGLFFAGIIFRHNVSWWGVSFQELRIQNLELIIFFLILLLPGYISAIKMRRFKIVIPFLIVYSLLNYFLNHFFPLFDPTVLFFALVMLPEPMTTPNNPKSQIIFGIFVAIISISVSLPISNFIPDPLIFALLASNLIFLKWR